MYFFVVEISVERVKVMNKNLFFAITVSFFAASFAELYSPEVWYSFRGDTLSFSAGVNDDDTGKTVRYELLQKNQDGKTTTLFSKLMKTDPKEWTLEFSGLKKDVVGKDALWVKETIDNDGNSKIYGPYGFVKSKLLENCDTLNSYSGDLKNFSLNADEIYKLAYNKNGLIVALGKKKDNLTVSIDPSNSKTAFLAFANRIIIYKPDESVSFFYPERNVETKTVAVQYKVRDWEGEMKIFDTANGKVLFIPWFDLGMKYENGRKFGFMINSDDFNYPAGASQYSPASWGNVILK
jgi:hypothetical protein